MKNIPSVDTATRQAQQFKANYKFQCTQYFDETTQSIVMILRFQEFSEKPAQAKTVDTGSSSHPPQKKSLGSYHKPRSKITE